MAAPPPTPAPPEPRFDETDDALARAVQAQARAEQIAKQQAQEYMRQQQAAPPETIDEYCDRMNLSPAKRSFLKEHPEMLHPERARVMAMHHGAAMAAGIPDDSETMARYLVEAVERDVGSHHSSRMVPPSQPQPTPPPQRQRSIPVSAPVSRGDISD